MARIVEESTAIAIDMIGAHLDPAIGRPLVRQQHRGHTQPPATWRSKIQSPVWPAAARARRKRPRRRRAAEQRYELAPFQLIDLHSVPARPGLTSGYRIGEDQSGKKKAAG